MNLRFIFDMIDSQIQGYEEQRNEGLLTSKEAEDKMSALRGLKAVLKNFIDEAKKLKCK